jgi:hypothetical protein
LSLYAHLELFFGILSCYATLVNVQAKVRQQDHQPLAAVALIGGSVYLFVRGLQDREDARKDLNK